MNRVHRLFLTGLQSRRAALILLAVIGGMFSTAHAQWTITTYLHPVGNPPIISMRIADQYFTGAKPQRFTGMSTVEMVDLWEGEGVGASGQFPINNPFPGLDNVPGPLNTDDFAARVTGTLAVNISGAYDFFARAPFRTWFRLDLNQDGMFDDAELIVPGMVPGQPFRFGKIFDIT